MRGLNCGRGSSRTETRLCFAGNSMESWSSRSEENSRKGGQRQAKAEEKRPWHSRLLGTMDAIPSDQPISIYPKENSPSSLFQNKNKPLLWTSVSTNILRNHEAKIRAYSINLCSQIALQEKSVPFHLVHLAKMSFPSVKKRHCPHSHFWKKKLCFLNVWDKKQTERFLRLIRE